MDNHINILIGLDINYAAYYGIMLTSLFLNNNGVQFDIYLLTDSTWTERETRKYRRLIEKYNSRLHVIEVDSQEMKGFPEITHVNLPSYYRLKASSLLPESVHKVLYLDGDIIVNGSLTPLWSTDISDYALAGVLDTIYYDNNMYERLGYDYSYGYINAGVALYNLNYWRENNVSSMAIQFIKQNRNRIKWMDQDVVNALLYKEILLLPICYNFQNRFLLNSQWKCFDAVFREDIIRAMEHPIIIHYCGSDKPWSYHYYRYPYSELFHYYRKKSLWSNSIIRSPFTKYMKFLWRRMWGHPSLDENVRQKFIPEAIELYMVK